MASLSKLREVIAQVLKSQIGGYPVETMQDELIQSKDLNRFMVICTGWHQNTAYHTLIQDVWIRPDGKVVIYADNTDQDLAEDLIAAGIPATAIIRAYDPEAMAQPNQVRPEERQQRMAA